LIDEIAGRVGPLSAKWLIPVKGGFADELWVARAKQKL
jgi:hypothetical protein